MHWIYLKCKYYQLVKYYVYISKKGSNVNKKLISRKPLNKRITTILPNFKSRMLLNSASDTISNSLGLFFCTDKFYSQYFPGYT